MTSAIREFFAWISFVFKLFIFKWMLKKKSKDWENFIKDKIGIIRRTGTSMACDQIKLPVCYVVKEQSMEEDCLVFYCQVKPDPEGTLAWMTESRVVVHDKSYELLRSPSKTVDPQFSKDTTLIVRGDVFYPSWQERIKFTVKR
jgi:hypothetical protein